jgi:hypothetical protein
MATANGVMLYIGADDDVEPITSPGPFTPDVRTFVYVDGLPGSAYWSNTLVPDRNSTKAKLVESILPKLGAFVDVSEPTLDKHLRFRLSDGRVLEYFINTTDADVLAGRVPRALSDQLLLVTHAVVKGFSPDTRVYALLPLLHTIVATPQCEQDFDEATLDLDVKFMEAHDCFEVPASPWRSFEECTARCRRYYY